MDDQTEGLYRDTVQKFLGVYRYLRQYGRQMHQEGISGRKISTLRYLLEAGPRTVGQLRDYLYINDSSTSQLIAWLEERGYVTRTRSEVDNRVVIVDLTAEGRDFAHRAPLGGISLLRERLRTLPAARLSVIHGAMVEIAQLLEIDNGC